jgi:L-ribulose-5-phosphate 4-epimerase
VPISRPLGEPVPMEQQHIDSLYDRYQNVYGQPATTPSGTTAADTKNKEGQA